jgi:hypothetical protein
MAKHKTAEQRAKLLQLLKAKTPVCEALRECGYSEYAASQGWDRVPQRVLARLPKDSIEMAELGKVDKDLRKNLIRGRLITNLLEGKDGGAMSAKILGSESELNMWTPDTQVGVIVLNTPDSFAAKRNELLSDNSQ